MFDARTNLAIQVVDEVKVTLEQGFGQLSENVGSRGT